MHAVARTDTIRTVSYNAYNIVRIVGFCESCASKWSPIVVYVYSSILLGRGSYRKLVRTAYT